MQESHYFLSHVFEQVPKPTLGTLGMPPTTQQDPFGKNRIDNDLCVLQIFEEIRTIAKAIKKLEESQLRIIKINLLVTKRIDPPIEATIEPDDGGFIARATDFNLFGYGDDPIEAINALKCEIESLYNDLMEDNDFSADWLAVKAFLKERVKE